jgi:hypothetical protein
MNRNLKSYNVNYEAPKVALIEVEVEKGFAGSPSNNGVIEDLVGSDEEIPW